MNLAQAALKGGEEIPRDGQRKLLQMSPPKAQPRDVRSSKCSRTEIQLWSTLCEYRNDQNLAWPGVKKLAETCAISDRTVQRGLKSLCEKGWLGTPDLKSGGEHKGTLYHLHPDGKPCVRCGSKPRQNVTGDKLSRVTTATSTGDISDIAYKEEPIKETTQKEKARKPAPTMPKQPDQAFVNFYAVYISETGVAVNESDSKKAEREWRRLKLEDQLAAAAFVPEFIDGRDAKFYQRPVNYLRDRPWSRVAVRKPQRQFKEIEDIR